MPFFSIFLIFWNTVVEIVEIIVAVIIFILLIIIIIITAIVIIIVVIISLNRVIAPSRYWEIILKRLPHLGLKVLSAIQGMSTIWDVYYWEVCNKDLF